MRRKLPPIKDWTSCSIPGQCSNHRSGRRVGPISITLSIALRYAQSQGCRNNRWIEYTSAVIYPEMYLQWTVCIPRCHGVVELPNYSRVVELSWSHKWEERIPLDQSHRLLVSGVGHQSRNVVERLLLKWSATYICIPRNGVSYEHGPPDPRGW